MSEGNQRPSRGGDYDYNKYYRGSLDCQDGGTRRNNMFSGELRQNNASRHSGAGINTGPDPPERSYNPYPPNRSHQVSRVEHEASSGEDHSKQTHSGRSPVGSHKLPFHKSFDTSHNSGVIGRGMYKHQPEHRGDYHLKDEFEHNGANKHSWREDRGKEVDGREGHHHSSRIQRPPYSSNNSMELNHKSSEANTFNFPSGHPNHNPHLPPPNPFSHHPSSYGSAQPLSRPNEKVQKQVRSGSEEITDGHQNTFGHNRLPNSSSNQTNISAFYGNCSNQTRY